MSSAPGILQRLKSYLADVPLDRHSSALNPDLYVVLREGQIELHASTVLYSRGHRYSSFRTALKKIDVRSFAPAKVLLLGLGLGSIPQMLDRDCKLRPSYTAVELDPIVLELFDKWFPSHLRPLVTTVQADACQWVELQSVQSGFDLICVDLFTDRLIPECAEQTSFLLALQKLSNPGGHVLFSRLSGTEAEHQCNLQFRDKYREIFAFADLIPCPGNDVIHAIAD